MDSMGISPPPLGATNDSGGNLSTFPGGHALCLKSSSAYALLSTGIRLRSLGGRGEWDRTALNQGRTWEWVWRWKRGESCCRALPGSLQFVMGNPLLSDIFNISSLLTSARSVSRGFWANRRSADTWGEHTHGATMHLGCSGLRGFLVCSCFSPKKSSLLKSFE